jgi:hypothetical protein
MFSIESCPIPDDALLGHYLKEGAYADCYVTDITGRFTHSQYVTAFYTTFVFKLERLILRLFVSRPSTDAQVADLATGTIEEFAAWHVEGRCDNQLLLCDFAGRTRSWLMVVPVSEASDIHTRLYFGSAVVPGKNPKTGKNYLGFVFRALLGFHKLYSVVLLYAARLQLEKIKRSDSAN